MRRNFWFGLILILAIIAAASYISLPQTQSFLGNKVEVRQGLDLKGGVRLAYELDFSKTPQEDRQDAIRSTIQVIENRVNITGAVEPVIQPGKLGEAEVVIVELPGIKDVDEAVKLIGQTAKLEFREQGASEGDWLPTGLGGKQLRKSSATFDQTTNEPQVSLTFNGEGAKLFAEITARNIGRPLAIFLDDDLISAPTVQSKITGGEAVITGQFTITETKRLANLLNAGALDVPLKLSEQRTVGATLGAESVQKSLIAGIIGLALVALFMLFNYRLAGLIAVIALAGYVVVTFAIFKIIPLTLTLAGIAGFILSIGMAVDANILIFERLREELKDGKPLSHGLDEAFRRAWPSVKDSNISTLITCAILFFTTTGSVKGFALTLAIGVIISLFSSITTSRALLRLFSFLKIGERLLLKT